MTYAVVNTNIWIFDMSQFKYVLHYNGTLEPMSNISTNGNRVIVVSRNRVANATRLFAIAFANTSNGLRPFFNFTNNYIGEIHIDIAESLETLLFIGLALPTPANSSNSSNSSNTSNSSGNASMKADAFSLTYSDLSAVKINFPREAIKDSEIPFVIVNDRFVYIRQVINKSLSSNASYM